MPVGSLLMLSLVATQKLLEIHRIGCKISYKIAEILFKLSTSTNVCVVVFFQSDAD